MLYFSSNDVAKMAGRTFFNRGMEYFRANKSIIKSHEMVSEEHLVIVALTRGTTNYMQSISVSQKGGHISISGRCSCPVGSDCKHVVSSALTFIDQQEPPITYKKLVKNEVNMWLNDLAASFEPEPSKSSILIYRISPTAYPGKMQLVFYRSRLLQKGGFGKQKRLEYHQLMNSFAQKDFLTQNDKDILELFTALQSKVSRVAYIEGELGNILLKKMVESGHAYWHGNRNTALTWGEARSAQPVWKEEEEGKYRLGFDLPKHFELLLTEPFTYIDTKSHVVGPLAVEGLGVKQLSLLLKAPLLTREALDAFTITVVQKLPIVPIPDVVVLKRICQQPIAKLRLFAEHTPSHVIHKMALTYLYDDVEVAGVTSAPKVLHTVDDKLIEVTRDLAYEQACKNQLHEAGFTQEENIVHLLYLPLLEGALAVETWRSFLLETLETLREMQWEVVVEKSFLYRFKEGGEVHIDIQERENWFDVGIDLEVGESRLNLVEMTSTLLESIDDFEHIPEHVNIEIEPNTFVSVASEQFAPILKTLIALYKGERVERINIEQYEAHILPKLGSSNKMSGSGLKRITKLKKELENFEGIDEVTLPTGLQATLREYQQEGLNWLGFLEKFGFGGILADDMGLGKTIQTLAFLQHAKEAERLKHPVLIVAPTSLLSNWKNEAHKFTPDLSLHIHHGLKRSKQEDDINKYDIIITTYALLARDIGFLEKLTFSHLVLDEAQNIKNHKSKAHSAAKKINTTNAVALSGTPMENHLGELWAIFDVVMPNFLDSYKNFKTFYQTPIEKEHDTQRSKLLRERIAPFVLRRTKEKVATELPPKTIMTRSVTFEKEQAKLYESIRISMEKRVREVIEEKGIGKSHITILDALLKLRQVCCDPRLVPLEEAQRVEHSAKLTMLLALVEELLAEGRRILIFSQFTSMLAIIEEALRIRDVSLTKLTGSTTNREKVIETFTSGKAEVFLISLKAGGVGLNLTQADTVIHYDPWWNPAAEDQATDRAYRIGQDKPVFVYKLIIEDSVEEKILALQQKKKERANALYSDDKKASSNLDAESLLELFS